MAAFDSAKILKSYDIDYQLHSSGNAAEIIEQQRKIAHGDGYDFVITVIIPVYNTESYIAEAIESIIHQTVGFDDTQLILVDDGSKDDSARVCKEFANRYPNNILFLQQENSGVSAARNLALPHVRGKWLNFFDSDDMWSGDAFETTFAYAEAHRDLRAVALRHWFFGKRSGPHPLDYKFEQDRIVDIFEDIDYPQLSFSNLFICSELIEGLFFDTKLHVAEDFAVVNELLMRIGKYGICSNGRYLYRKRESGNSALDLSADKPSYYNQTPRFCHQKLFNSSKNMFGKVIPYIQWCVMYDLQWRLRTPVSSCISKEEASAYRDMIIKLLSQIDDEIISTQRHMYMSDVIYAFSLKYDIDIKEIMDNTINYGNQWYWSHSGILTRLRALTSIDRSLRMDFITIEKNTITFEGYCNFLDSSAEDHVSFGIFCNGKPIEYSHVTRYDLEVKRTFPRNNAHKQAFKSFIPWDGNSKIVLTGYVQFDNTRMPAKFTFNKFTGLADNLEHSYWHLENALLRYLPNPGGEPEIVIEKYALHKQIAYEEKLSAELLSRSRGNRLVAWRALGLKAYAEREMSSKQVWLISDRPMKGGDNGEALFMYLRENPVKNVEPVFAISKRSSDWDRLSKVGKVVDFGSPEYRRTFLRSNLVISSSGDDIFIKPFGDRSPYIKDLFGFKFVFLQHGITKDDISSWINRYTKNVKLFVTAAQREKESIENDRYGFADGVVQLTGFPRHDSLVAEARSREKSRTIYLLPTWRRNLMVGKADPDTLLSNPNPNFINTDYYAFYQGLISNQRLIDALTKYDYEMKFVMHPSFVQEADKFHGNDKVTILPRCDYRSAFVDGSLLITDYSSVAFDFALLEKPIIYTQFDRDTFFSGHFYTQGYFSYDDDGFGPICRSIDETVDAIIDFISSNCQLTDKYAQRIHSFFGDQPENRCKLLVEKLLEL